MPEQKAADQSQQACLHAIIHGHVQGVSFRYYTTQTARRLGLTGWVRNRPDHTVEVRAEGARHQLEQLHAFLKAGPPAARVTQVDVTWAEATRQLTTFEIRHD
ncbi:MAG: acylphosphatase [Anaerolineae bacterium]|nr:acylphosphatase [Anaerolineae bacterium]